MRRLPVALTLVLLIAGCAAVPPDPHRIVVFAAASLRDAFTDLDTAFRAADPDAAVEFSFAGSADLLAQLTGGARADVFASADTDTMDKAVAKGVVAAADVKIFTTNKLVVIVPLQSKTTLQQRADLKKPDIKRIAMGTPASVPAGHYAQGSLEKAGLWSELKDKVINTTNVRQALDYVSRDEVDAGFVYASDAQLMQDKVKVAMQVTTLTPIQYPIAPVVGSANKNLSVKFIQFLQSPLAQTTLKKYGFGH